MIKKKSFGDQRNGRKRCADLRREMWTALVAGVLCIVSIWGGLAAVGQADLPFAASPAPAEQDPDADLTEGSASQGQFQAVRTLSIDHGSRVNFWIRNNGAVPVEITIDRTRARVIQPGAEGHISADIDFSRRDYTFRARTETDSGKIDIDYKIAQRA